MLVGKGVPAWEEKVHPGSVGSVVITITSLLLGTQHGTRARLLSVQVEVCGEGAVPGKNGYGEPYKSRSVI